MTCRCGHEICWRCGKDYVKEGRRGHSFNLFPRPSEYKYCCNNTRQWVERVGAVTLGVPAAAVAASIAIPIGTLYIAGKLVRGIHANAVDSYRRRQYRQRQRHLAAMTRTERMTANVVSNCNGYHDGNSAVEPCRSCDGQVDCLHVFPIEGQYPGANPFICQFCNHFELHDHACAHFHATPTSNCTFCGRQPPNTPSSVDTSNAQTPPSVDTSNTQPPVESQEKLSSKRVASSSVASSSSASTESITELLILEEMITAHILEQSISLSDELPTLTMETTHSLPTLTIETTQGAIESLV